MKTITFEEQMSYLKLNFTYNNLDKFISHALDKKLDYLDFFKEVIEAEIIEKKQRASERRLRSAKLAPVKLLADFDFSLPKKIDEQRVRFHHNQLQFIEKKQNLIFIGNTGVGKTHLINAIGANACAFGYTVLFVPAVEIINTLSAAQRDHNLERVIKQYLKPQCLIIDELGYIPIDKQGCDLFFQVISRRYEKSSTIISTNRVYSEWVTTFNNESVVTSVILDRLLHHADTITIEGSSYRMKDAKSRQK